MLNHFKDSPGKREPFFLLLLAYLFRKCELKDSVLAILPLWCHIGDTVLQVHVWPAWYLCPSKYVKGRKKHQLWKWKLRIFAGGFKQRAKYAISSCFFLDHYMFWALLLESGRKTKIGKWVAITREWKEPLKIWVHLSPPFVELPETHAAGALPSPPVYLKLPDLLPCKISDRWQDAVSSNQIRIE